MDIDSRQHLFDLTSTKLSVMPIGPYADLGRYRVTPNIMAMPMHGPIAHTVAISGYVSLKQCP